MRYLPINLELFVGNRKRFANKLNKNSVAIFNSNDEMNRTGDQFYPYRQNADLFYLSGIEQEKSILLIAPDHPEPKFREILFIREANPELEKWFGHKLTKKEASEISGIKTVQFMDRFDSILREVVIGSEYVYLNSNEYVKFETELVSRDHRFAQEIKDKFPAHKFERSAPIMAKLRTKKSKYEIELMQKAMDITNKAFRRVLEYAKPGLKEYEVQAEIEYIFTANSANGHAYPPIIASGKSACVLHYVENDKECKDGDLLLMDFGAEYANYAADLTRTIPVNGKFSPRQRAVYDAVLRVQKKAIKLLVVGNCINEVNKKVNEYMSEEILTLGLITQEQAKNPVKAKEILFKYFMHGTSHFLGLDVHDVGTKYQPFEEGMIFTCEPGLYIDEEGIGVRLENDIMVTKDGPLDMMANIPIDPDEIERLMAQ